MHLRYSSDSRSKKSISFLKVGKQPAIASKFRDLDLKLIDLTCSCMFLIIGAGSLSRT